MKIATTIAADIDAAAEKAKYDTACKRLLAEKVLLTWIMKSTMKEYAACSIQEITRQYILGTPQVAEVPLAPDETNQGRIPGTGVEDC